MKHALWFSRHAPTPEQLEEISAKGFSLCALEEGAALGSIAIDENLFEVVESLSNLALRETAKAIFGVFPTPVLGYAFQSVKPFTEAFFQGPNGFTEAGAILLFAAHNVSRTPEGATKPTFSHKEWVQVGVL